MAIVNRYNAHILFILSVLLKAFNALFEIVLGVLLFFTGKAIELIIFSTRHELIEDPTDFLATRLADLIPYLSTHSQAFASFYLLSHGIVKVFLVWGLLKKRLWAYPASIFFLILFIVYQLYKISAGHSLFLIALTIFDIMVIWLILNEYKNLRKVAIKS